MIQLWRRKKRTDIAIVKSDFLLKVFNALNTNPTKWSKNQTIRRCLSVFDHFVGLVLKGLISNICQKVLLSVPSPFIFVTVSYIKSLNVFMLKFVLQLTSSNPTTFGKPFSSKTGTPPLYLHATNRERIILCISCT